MKIMKRGAFIILFVVLILFISGQQSCEPTIQIGEIRPNTCCTLETNSGVKNCISDISQNKCDELYNLYPSYYIKEVYETNLANSCKDRCDTSSLSCTVENSIFENGEFLCTGAEGNIVIFGENVYLCNNGKRLLYAECDTCTNNIPCKNQAIIEGSVFCWGGTGNSCVDKCSPLCEYANECARNGTDMGDCNLDSACNIETENSPCNSGAGICRLELCCPMSGNVLLLHLDNVLTDLSGSNNNGYGYGSPVFGDSITGFSKALILDGNNDYIRVTSSTSLNFGAADSFSVGALIKFYDITHYIEPNAYSAIISKYTYPAFYEIGVAKTGQVSFGIRGSNGVGISNVISPAPLNDDKWHYVVGVRNVIEDKVKLYVDGILVSEITDSTTATLATNSYLAMGHRSDILSGVYFKGLIDEATIWRRALTSQEISYLYRRAKPLCA